MWGAKKQENTFNENICRVVPQKMFQLEMGQYGPQVIFSFLLGGKNLNLWIDVPQKTRDDNGVITPNQYYDSQVEKFQSTMTQFLTGFYPEVEEDAMIETLQNFESEADFISALYEKLPDDWNERPAEVIVYKDDDGYLKIPKSAAQNLGRLFSAHEEMPLVVSDFFLEKVVAGNEPVPSSAPTKW
jgi:hypothetical protein